MGRTDDDNGRPSHNRPPVTLLALLLLSPTKSVPPKTCIRGNLKMKCDAILKSVIDDWQMELS